MNCRPNHFTLITCQHDTILNIVGKIRNPLLKLISPVSLCSLTVATKMFKIIYVAHFTFLLHSSAPDFPLQFILGLGKRRCAAVSTQRSSFLCYLFITVLHKPAFAHSCIHTHKYVSTRLYSFVIYKNEIRGCLLPGNCFSPQRFFSVSARVDQGRHSDR